MNPTNVLFLAEGQLGDLLLLTPAIRSLKESRPSSEISVLIAQRKGGGETDQTVSVSEETVLATNPNVSRTFVLDREAVRRRRGMKRIKAELGIVRFLREGRFDTVVCTFPEDRFALWAYFSGALVRVGQWKQGFSWLLTHRPKVQKGDRGVLEYYCDLVRCIGATVTSTRTEYIVPETANRRVEEFFREHALDLQRRIVAIHPGASGDYKIWPPDRYAALINRLQDELGVRVILCYGPLDTFLVEEIMRRLKGQVLEFNATATVGLLAALLQRSVLCISNDSGPRHLAVAVGTPSLSLFRQQHHLEWQVYPETSTCMTLKGKDDCPVCPANACLDRIPGQEKFGSHCIRMISVDEVIHKVGRFLGV